MIEQPERSDEAWRLIGRGGNGPPPGQALAIIGLEARWQAHPPS